VKGEVRSALWAKLLPGHRRWLAVNALLLTAVTNLFVNALIAWVSVRNLLTVPLWAVPVIDRPSTITDTVGTFFLLPLTTCLICTTAVRLEVRRGRLSPLRLSQLGSIVARLPEGRFRRGAVLGAACSFALSPIAVGVLLAADFGDVSRAEFVAYKAALGVALGAIVTPIIALRAMADRASDA
jgi:hypothetical protein